MQRCVRAVGIRKLENCANHRPTFSRAPDSCGGGAVLPRFHRRLVHGETNNRLRRVFSRGPDSRGGSAGCASSVVPCPIGGPPRRTCATHLAGLGPHGSNLANETVRAEDDRQPPLHGVHGRSGNATTFWRILVDRLRTGAILLLLTCTAMILVAVMGLVIVVTAWRLEEKVVRVPEIGPP